MAEYRAGRSETGIMFVPLLFGGDINVYSVSLAFYDAYDVIPRAYGKYPTGPDMNSAIVDYTANEKADDPDTFKSLVEAFAKENADKKVLLIGCGDNYVSLASRFKDELPENVIAPYIDIDLMTELTNKERFYAFCEAHGVNYPDTFVWRRETGYDFKLPFDGPFAVKPSDSVMYWQYPFRGQKKAYILQSFDEVLDTLRSIEASGYHSSVIIQNFIPGDDSFMRVLTCYSDRSGKVVMMCLGHVLLEEHTPHGIGNHAVIITEYDRELMGKFHRLLEELHYVGVSNFDIKYDVRDGKFKAFEINTRQGRSNYYVTASGANLARLFVRDRIDEKDLQLDLVDNEFLWSVIPKKVMLDYINPEYKERVKRLLRENKFSNPLLNPAETDLKKRLAILKNQAGHFVKYRKYLGKKK